MQNLSQPVFLNLVVDSPVSCIRAMLQCAALHMPSPHRHGITDVMPIVTIALVLPHIISTSGTYQLAAEYEQLAEPKAEHALLPGKVHTGRLGWNDVGQDQSCYAAISLGFCKLSTLAQLCHSPDGDAHSVSDDFSYTHQQKLAGRPQAPAVGCTMTSMITCTSCCGAASASGCTPPLRPLTCTPMAKSRSCTPMAALSTLGR